MQSARFEPNLDFQSPLYQLYGNPSSGSRDDACGQADRRTDGRTGMTRSIACNNYLTSIHFVGYIITYIQLIHGLWIM